MQVLEATAPFLSSGALHDALQTLGATISLLVGFPNVGVRNAAARAIAAVASNPVCHISKRIDRIWSLYPAT